MKNPEVASIMEFALAYAKQKTITFLDYNDVDAAISAYLGIDDYCICAEEELSNDSDWVVDVKPVENTRYIDVCIANRDYQYHTKYILNKMCLEGYIPEGCYAVRVSW